jgi:peroxidase
MRMTWIMMFQIYRSIDGSCNNLANSNFGRAGTPYQRILLPEYASGSIDLPRRRSADNFELPSAREVSNMLTAKPTASEPQDPANSVLVMQMGQFIDHDLTHTPNHGLSCCTNGNLFPASFDADTCFPIQMFPDDPFWRGRKTCMSFARSLASPSLKCSLQTREQLNQADRQLFSCYLIKTHTRVHQIRILFQLQFKTVVYAYIN